MLIIFVEWLPVLNLYSLSYEWIPFHLSRTSAMRVRHYNNQMKPNGKKNIGDNEELNLQILIQADVRSNHQTGNTKHLIPLFLVARSN